MKELVFNPPFGLAESAALALIGSLAGLWLAWRGTRGAGSHRPLTLLALRATGVTLLGLVWLNPGRWQYELISQRRDWVVLLDRSASMAAEQAAKQSRWQAALQLVGQFRPPDGADEKRLRVRLRTFASELEPEIAVPGTVRPEGKGTGLAEAVTQALEQNGAELAGLVIVSDGRTTSRAKLEPAAQRARGRGVPIYAVPMGGSGGGRDLSVTALTRQVLAFEGQPAKLLARLENHGLGPIKPTLQLLGSDGAELAQQSPALAEGAEKTVTFDLPPGPKLAGEYTLRVAPWAGEQLVINNTDHARVQVLKTRIRVLLLEGAPYWDSKFLAQLLRQQQAMEILTVHRLNEERYFRVEASGATPLSSPETVLPATAEGLGRYDLIVFGKGADGFLTPPRIAALQGFIRDQGGAVLFARGKPYTGRFPGLEPLEPVEWGESIGGGFRFVPLADAGAGLFGAALPAADDRAWKTLPPLEDVRGVARLRPFARVLAEGALEGKELRLPLLIARRYGRGTIATLNADGLWRWDFRPEIREQGAVYQQFWVQLMSWCATWSEFRPGEDYAVRLRENRAEPGQVVRAIIAYRGPNTPEPRPRLRVLRDGLEAQLAVATALPVAEGGREWAALFTPGQPGRYEFQVIDEARPDRAEGAATLVVPKPQDEADDLRPDHSTLELLARESGGRVFSTSDAQALQAALWTEDSAARRGKPYWEPLWTRAWLALVMAGCFGTEWWIRRREGLL